MTQPFPTLSPPSQHSLLARMCLWMGSHFHDSVYYNGVAFSLELPGADYLELRTRMGSHILDFWGITFFTIGVSKRTRILVL